MSAPVFPLLHRRLVLKSALRLGAVGMMPGGLALLGSCGGGDAPPDSADARPGDDIPVIDQPEALTVRVQARRVQWVRGQTPSQDNAWVYAIDGSTPAGALANHLGPTINVRRGVPCTVTWINELPGADAEGRQLATPPINPPAAQAICGAVQAQSDVGVVTHLHGAHVVGEVDGWSLAPLGVAGNAYGLPTRSVVRYPNAQRASLLWYHDHAMDNTGRHVHAGLAGLYCVRDAADDAVLALLGGAAQEWPLVIQDRVLREDGLSIDMNAGIKGVGDDDAGGSRPEFLGDTVFVNGHPAGPVTAPRRVLRLRVLNACNTRTLALALCDPDALGTRARIWYSDRLQVIGADGGLLGRSVAVTATDAVLIAPAQRRDLLLDLSALPTGVSRLRLVNLALRPLAEVVRPHQTEGLFTRADQSLLLPLSDHHSPLDLTLYGALLAPQSRVMDLQLAAAPAEAPAPPRTASLDAILSAAGTDDDFRWDGIELGVPPGQSPVANRLVLLITNTQGLQPTDVVSGVTDWNALQMFELGTASAGDAATWSLPFAVDLGGPGTPAAGAPSTAQQTYALKRQRFFAAARNPDIRTAGAYPERHAPAIVARAGTWERWYVANLGNSQPLAGDDPGLEMHPFHVHGLHMVAQRRWQLEGDASSSRFVEQVSAALDLDRIARQDTVSVPSGGLVELLVHIPADNRGDYSFHCHLLEHEDQCMMSHLQVVA